MNKLVNPELETYVETKIFPRYEKTKGHGIDHIKNVIRRSLDFAERINEGKIPTEKEDFMNLPDGLNDGKINYDMAFTIAAFHDLGREENDALHHLISAAFLLTDKTVQEFFNRDQLRVMADAIMDHRASNKFPPITIYGKIVSSADRDTDYKDIIRRAYAYNRAKYPEKTEKEALEVVREKLYIKFGCPDAYGAKKMFFKNPEYEKMIKIFARITPDPKIFNKEAKEILKNI